MEKVVYILGAGFSAFAGLPVMSNFLDKAKDQYFADAGERFQHFKKVFDFVHKYSFIKNYMDTNLLNIEELLSIADMVNFTQKKKSDPKLIVEFVIDVVNYYEQLQFENIDLRPPGTYEAYPFPENRVVGAYAIFLLSLFGARTAEAQILGGRQMYQRISIPKTVEYSIITFNYDRVLERTVELLNAKFPCPEPMRFVRSGETGSGIRLCKLHGSTDRRDIIPPTWGKRIDRNLEQDWADAFSLIGSANHIRIVGFSFPSTDSHISYLFKGGVSANENLKRIDAVCLDNEQREVQSKFERLFVPPKRRFRSMQFEEYMNNIGVTPAEDRRSRIYLNGNLEETHFRLLG